MYTNPIMQLLRTGNNQVGIPSGLATGANKMFSGGINAFQKVADDLDTVKRNKAIDTLLSTVDMTDPYAGQQSAISGLLGIRGVDPKDAITLGTGIASPYIDKARDDATMDYRNRSLTETGRHNLAMETKTTPKGYGMVTDEYGTTYAYNKDTGEYKAIQGTTTGNIPPKFIGYTNVEVEDPATGIVTKKQVAFDKRNPGVSLSGTPIETTKYPTVSKNDKEYMLAIPTMSKMIDDLEGIITGNSGAFGPLDNWTGRVGAMYGSPDGKAQTEARAVSSNLLAGFGKAQMAGVLTDQDMKIIKAQIPMASDTQTEATQKIKFLKDFMKTKNKAWLEQMDRTNPGFVPDGLIERHEGVPTELPPGSVDNGDGTYTLPGGQVVRKKG